MLLMDAGINRFKGTVPAFKTGDDFAAHRAAHDHHATLSSAQYAVSLLRHLLAGKAEEDFCA